MKCSVPFSASVFALVFYIFVGSWHRCFFLIYFRVYELSAVCSDARRLHEPLTNAELVIDDTEEDCDGQVTLHCQVPVFVYYRDANSEASHRADDAASSPWGLLLHRKKQHDVSLEKYRQRAVRTNVMCSRNGHPDLGAYYPHCEQRQWHCFDSLCSAYEKARRLCAGQISQEPYPCFYVPGDSAAGISMPGVSFPLIWLSISLAATILLLQWLWLLGINIKHDCKDNLHMDGFKELLSMRGSGGQVGGAKKWIFCLLGTMILGGFICNKIWKVSQHPDERAAEGRVTHSIGDIGADHEEMPVPISIWTVTWDPSPALQVMLLLLASLTTMIYQVWFSRWLRAAEYASLPQGPHRRSSQVVPQWIRNSISASSSTADVATQPEFGSPSQRYESDFNAMFRQLGETNLRPGR